MDAISATNELPPILEVKDKTNADVVEAEVGSTELIKPKPITFRIDQPIYINGNAIYGTYTLGQTIPMPDGKGNPTTKIDKRLMQMLLSRAAQARTQEERIYQNEGTKINITEQGHTVITRKL